MNMNRFYSWKLRFEEARKFDAFKPKPRLFTGYLTLAFSTLLLLMVCNSYGEELLRIPYYMLLTGVIALFFLGRSLPAILRKRGADRTLESIHPELGKRNITVLANAAYENWSYERMLIIDGTDRILMCATVHMIHPGDTARVAYSYHLNEANGHASADIMRIEEVEQVMPSAVRIREIYGELLVLAAIKDQPQLSNELPVLDMSA